jgi:outer membrane lipoprotein-sorting protein
MAAARDPNKLEPAYLITLALIVGAPFCCSYLSRSAPTAPRMKVPERGTWTARMENFEGRGTRMRVAIRDGKWRMETNDPAQIRTVVIVHDGKHAVTNNPEVQPSQLEAINPVGQLEMIADAYNRHPKPDSVLLDGVLCWHAKVQDGENEGEAWIDGKTGFPKKFIATRRNRGAMTVQFEGYSSESPSDPRVFDANALEPLLQ